MVAVGDGKCGAPWGQRLLETVWEGKGRRPECGSRVSGVGDVANRRHPGSWIEAALNRRLWGQNADISVALTSSQPVLGAVSSAHLGGVAGAEATTRMSWR